MSDRLLIAFVHPGPGTDRPVLGLTGLHRSVLGLGRAGFDRVVVVPSGGLDAAGALALLPPAARATATALERRDAEGEADLVRRAAGNATAVAVLDSDVVVGPKDAAALAERLAAGRALSVEDGLLSLLPARALVRMPAGADLPAAVSALEGAGLLDRVSAPLLVRRLDGTRAVRRQVEDLLLRGLRKPLVIDGVVGYYLQRPVTTRISRFLSRTPIRPNHITVLAMIAGVASGVFVAFGGPLWTALGGVLFLLGSYIDCLDGEIARLKFQFSPMGEWLDTIADDSSTLSFLIGMTVNLWAYHGSPALLGVGAATAVAFTLASAYVYHRLITVIGSGDLTRFTYPFLKDDTADSDAPMGVLDALKFIIKRDFFSAFFCLCACVGVLEAAFAFCVAGAFGFAIAVAYTAWLQHAPGTRMVTPDDVGGQTTR